MTTFYADGWLCGVMYCAITSSCTNILSESKNTEVTSQSKLRQDLFQDMMATVLLARRVLKTNSHRTLNGEYKIDTCIGV